VVRSLAAIRTELSEGFHFVSGNKLLEAQAVFQSVLHALLLVIVSSDGEAKEVSGLNALAAELRLPVLVARHGCFSPRILIRRFN